jgi:hypothetical protein
MSLIRTTLGRWVIVLAISLGTGGAAFSASSANARTFQDCPNGKCDGTTNCIYGLNKTCCFTSPDDCKTESCLSGGCGGTE